MKAKYSIQNKDRYSFDKTGFIMGQMLTGAVVTGSDCPGGQSGVRYGDDGASDGVDAQPSC
jgi:hypothetical protein